MERERVELKVQNIFSDPRQPNSYVLLLGEAEGARQLHVSIGASEVQALIIELRGIDVSRPMTHNLFASVLEVLGVRLLRVLIYKVQKGIFYSYLYLKTSDALLRVDARTSDAITLAIRMRAPILTYETVLEAELQQEETGIRPEMSHHPSEDGLFREDTVEMLEAAMQKAVKDENYELAASLRDEINRLKKQS